MNYLRLICTLIIVLVPAFAFPQKAPMKGLELLDEREYLLLEEVPLLVRGPLPESATLENMFPKCRSQGDYPSCTTWATSYAKSYRIYLANGKNGSPDQYLQSPLFIYSALTRARCNAGTSMYVALQFLKARGSVPWEVFPYSDTSCPDWRRVIEKAGNKSQIAYRLSRDPKLALQQIRSAVVDGSPVIAGIYACSEFDRAGRGIINEIKDDSNCGPHAILVVGYDDRIRAVRILNSWGENWGDRGKVWMSYDVFLKRYSGQAFVDFGPGELAGDYEWLKDLPTVADPTEPLSRPVSTLVTDTILRNALRTSIDPKVLATIDNTDIKVQKWSIWLNLPREYVAQVRSVEYYFLGGNFKNPKRSIANSSVFLAEWKGVGCVPNAYLIARLKDGRNVKAEFNFCKVVEDSVYEGIIRSQVEPQTSSPNKEISNMNESFDVFIQRFLSDSAFAATRINDGTAVFKILKFGNVNKHQLTEQTLDKATVLERMDDLRLKHADPFWADGRVGDVFLCFGHKPINGACRQGDGYSFAESENGWVLGGVYVNQSAR